jgi:hypothetical protein
MELDAREVRRILADAGVTTLYHANTVRTACSFLRDGRLLSRGTLAEKGYPQTEQQSDAIDRQHGLWYDIFVDSVDIHNRRNSRNFYGPVLFEFNLELLEQDWMSYVWITKNNPSQWNENTQFAEKYYQSAQEFRENFRYGNFDKLIVLRGVGGVLRLDQFLTRIVVDCPEREIEGNRAFDHTIGALRASAIAGGIPEINIAKRECSVGCQCRTQYVLPQMSPQVFQKFFKP